MADATRGRFVWHDLMTPDPAAAERFYTDVVGWSTMAWEGADKPYTMWMTGETSHGGVMELPEEARAQGAPPHWMTYVGTPDIDATVARAKELGAAVYLPATDIPSVGRFAVLGDPQGASFAVFEPGEGSPPPREGMPEPGGFTWHELLTTDREAAFGFYADLFGWEKTDAMDMGPELGVYQMYGLGGRSMGGIYENKGAMEGVPPHWLPYTRVADLDGAVARAKAGGAAVLNGPMEVPGGDRIAVLRDPQGAAFALHEVKSVP